MKKKLKWLMFLAFILIVSVLLFKTHQLNEHNIYHRNRMIEHEYLKRIVHDCEFKADKFNARFNTKKAGLIILDSGTVLADPYFEENKYSFRGTDFYGYEFQFDELGNLKRYGFYKP